MTFVDAPYAPRDIDVVYSTQEDVTVVRWRMSASHNDPAVSFELLDQTGAWRAIDFAASVYPGGVAPCGSGSGLCAQTVLAGPYQPPSGSPTVIRSRNPTYGTSPGDAPALRRIAKTLSLRSYFLRGNTMVAATIGDTIGNDPVFVFPRQLQRSLWERRGVCISGFRPDDAQFDPVDGLQKAWPAPATLSAVGHYCASVRAVKTSGDPGVDEPIAIDTLPEVTDGKHVHTVRTEITPFSYQIVLDLSIPVADRCQEAIQSIPSMVSSALGQYGELRPFPFLDLSAQIDPETGAPGTPCRQSPLRALDYNKLSQQVKDAAAQWPEQHQRFFLLYFNNLRAPLPDLLSQSLYDFRSTITIPPTMVDLQALLWPFGPEEMTQSFQSFGGWDLESTPWLTATDPAFFLQLEDYGSRSLPLISEIQDPNELIPILAPEDAQKLDGGLIRLCQVSIAPVDGAGLQLAQHDASGNPVPLAQNAFQWPVHEDNPPAYLLSVPPVWAVSSVGFMPHKSLITYEVCTRYCDHAFTAESGTPVTNGWIGNALCMGPA